MSTSIRLVVVSDLHYRKHQADADKSPYRPATAEQGIHTDPMIGLYKFLQENSADLTREDGSIADFLLCPGDISDRASAPAFDEGWQCLKVLQEKLKAKHLISSTGNHEVDSRADQKHDIAGNVEIAIDPLHALHKHSDYPSTALAGSDRRWIYWGRGYEFIEQENVTFLLVNSSQFHATTRENEFERGRIGEVALQELRAEIKSRVKRDERRLYVLLLHHHPIPHEDLDVDLGKIPMDNGAKLMEVLAESKAAWLVIHGHKHHPRLVRGQGSGGAIVFAAGTFGAAISGTLATKTRPQFYLIEAQVSDQRSQPEASGTVRAFSWTGSDWVPSVRRNQGLPDRCGFRVPQPDLSALAKQAKEMLDSQASPFLPWDEMTALIPSLRLLLPEELIRLRDAFEVVEIKATWASELWLPTDVAK